MLVRKSLLLFLATSFVASPVFSKHDPVVNQQESNLNIKPFTGKVTGTKVRLRVSPDIDSFVVKELGKGEMLAVDKEDNGYFGVIPSSDVKLYVFRTFILDNKVEGDRVNVRLKPNLESPIVAQLNAGDEVEVLQFVENSKWAEISAPKDTHFWVAKEYVDAIGSIDYLAKYQKRREEVQNIFKTAQLLSQAEFRKPFTEIDLERTVISLEKIMRDFPEFEEFAEKSKELIHLLKESYAEKKIAYLENKAGIASKEVETLKAQLPNVGDNSVENLKLNQSEEDSLTSRPHIDTYALSLSDKMKVWEPVEEALFQLWANESTELSIQDFYEDELLNSVVLSGYIEPFTQPLKSKPGDYMLVQNNKTVAYLYSTHLNLSDKVGSETTLKVVPRNNKHFAYPAFYVLSEN